MRALITGGTGFAGGYLSEFLLAQGWSVTAVSNIRDSAGPPGVNVVTADVSNAEAIARVIHEVQPDHVYHLAAISSVPDSWRDPQLTLTVNVWGTYNVFRACEHLAQPVRILYVSTAHVYSTGCPTPIREDWPVRPATPYASSKAMGEIAALQFVAHGSHIVIARPFNHSGPRQTPDFVLPALTRQVAEIQAGLRPPVVEAGDLNVRRDLLDVRDAVRAYYCLLADGVPGEAYNVCSGFPCLLTDVVDALKNMAGVNFDLALKQGLGHSGQPSTVVGDFAKIQKQTRWCPTIPLERTLRDLLEYWRTQPRRSVGSSAVSCS
ncbi:MAG: GDP-mannose 4,6-dehydratase [Acidobacteriia bacterium]|nr:GDP-mannose 4,6-dehydratase [Terriglobia bacterium]